MEIDMEECLLDHVPASLLGDGRLSPPTMTAGAIIEYLSSGDISLVSLHLVFVYTGTGALPRLKWPQDILLQ